ncbi:MAG: hypothetical protein HY053_09655 [Proteobacteria bacterium]|nr:hypothetical protein [Pseudomonadota bacterium]
MMQLIQFSLMAPDLASRILKGDIPAQVTRESLVYNWPSSWEEQHKLFE